MTRVGYFFASVHIFQYTISTDDDTLCLHFFLSTIWNNDGTFCVYTISNIRFQLMMALFYVYHFQYTISTDDDDDAFLCTLSNIRFQLMMVIFNLTNHALLPDQCTVYWFILHGSKSGVHTYVGDSLQINTHLVKRQYTTWSFPPEIEPEYKQLFSALWASSIWVYMLLHRVESGKISLILLAKPCRLHTLPYTTCCPFYLQACGIHSNVG